MSYEIPTVRVVNPLKPDEFIIINEADRRPEHVLWGAATALISAEIQTVTVTGVTLPDPLTVGKGPGGRWYVKRGKEIVTGPFASKEDADAAIENEASA